MLCGHILDRKNKKKGGEKGKPLILWVCRVSEPAPSVPAPPPVTHLAASTYTSLSATSAVPVVLELVPNSTTLTPTCTVPSPLLPARLLRRSPVPPSPNNRDPAPPSLCDPTNVTSTATAACAAAAAAAAVEETPPIAVETLSPLVNAEAKGSAAVGEKRSGPSGVSSVCDRSSRAARPGVRREEEEEEDDDGFQGRGGRSPAAMAMSNACREVHVGVAEARRRGGGGGLPVLW